MTVKWQRSAPTPEQCEEHEFWWRRVWIEDVDIVDVYRVMHKAEYVNDKLQKTPLLMCGVEQVFLTDITEDDFIEWCPVLLYPDDTTATSSINFDDVTGLDDPEVRGIIEEANTQREAQE